MVIKNFFTGYSELLRQIFIDGTYEYRPLLFLNPGVGIGGALAFYQDHNRKEIETLTAKCDLYFPWLTTFYILEHSRFRFLTPNYFSYKGQIWQWLGLKLHQEFRSKFYLEAVWQHMWQSTRELIMPIGEFLFIAQHQYIVGNIFALQGTYRYHDQLQLNLGAHYYRTSLIYRDWNIHGSILWQF